MMRWMILAVLATAATGCGMDCTFAEPSGLYMVHAERLSGTCGEMSDQLIAFDANSTSGCTTTRIAHSEDMCTRQFKQACVTDGIRSETTASVEFKDEDGKEFGGIMTFRVRDAPYTCTGTYKVRYKRT
jgi:hypothetical protein